jgi:hypothetical protein
MAGEKGDYRVWIKHAFQFFSGMSRKPLRHDKSPIFAHSMTSSSSVVAQFAVSLPTGPEIMDVHLFYQLQR